MRNIERVLRKGFLWVLLFSLIVSALVGAYLYLVVPDEYTARATLMVTLRTGNGGEQVYDASAYNLFVHDCKEIIRYRWLREDAATYLPEGQTLGGVAFAVEGAEDSQLLMLSAVAHEPQQAVDGAEAMTQAFGVYVSTLSQVDQIYEIEKAELPTSPTGPNRKQSIAAAFALCMVLGGVVCILIGLLRRRVNYGDPIEAQYGVPVLGSVQGFTKEYKAFAKAPKDRALLDAMTRSVREQLGALCANLQVAAQRDGLRTLAITSSCAAEGKSCLTVLLGMTLARQGMRVLLVDMDCYSPSLRGLLSVQGDRNWLDCAEGRATLDEAIVPTGFQGLSLLDNRRSKPATVTLMSSAAALALREEMLERFDYVLYDTPPASVFADAMAIGHAQDATLLALANGRVKKRNFVRAVDRLQKSDAHLLGMVYTYARANRVDYAHLYEDYEDREDAKPSAQQAVKRRKRVDTH